MLRIQKLILNQNHFRNHFRKLGGSSASHGHSHGESHKSSTNSHGESHGHGHGHELHLPEFYNNVAKGCLLTAYLWVFYNFKEDGAQLFGVYQPWLHPHDHDEVLKFNEDGDEGDKMPAMVEEEESEEHEDAEEEDHEEE